MRYDEVVKKLDRAGQLTIHRSDAEDLIAAAYQAGLAEDVGQGWTTIPTTSYERNLKNAWLAGGDDERERIIKLLEDEYELGSHEMGIVPHLIALIKGENK